MFKPARLFLVKYSNKTLSLAETVMESRAVDIVFVAVVIVLVCVCFCFVWLFVCLCFALLCFCFIYSLLLFDAPWHRVTLMSCNLNTNIWQKSLNVGNACRIWEKKNSFSLNSSAKADNLTYFEVSLYPLMTTHRHYVPMSGPVRESRKGLYISYTSSIITLNHALFSFWFAR